MFRKALACFLVEWAYADKAHACNYSSHAKVN